MVANNIIKKEKIQADSLINDQLDQDNADSNNISQA